MASLTTSKILSGASSLVFLQVITRVVTFILNQAVVRLAPPHVFGTAAIQFELLLSSILFLSREGVRLALLRTPATKPPTIDSTSEKDRAHVNEIPTATTTTRQRKGKQKVPTPSVAANTSQGESQATPFTAKEYPQLATNISTVPFLAGIPLSIGLAFFYSFTANEEASSQPHFHIAIFIYVLAAIVELSAEPLYIRAQNDVLISARVQSEGLGVILRTFATVGLLLGAGSDWNLVAFAAGQLAYALTVLAVYWTAYRKQPGVWNLVPKKVYSTFKEQTQTRLFDASLWKLSVSMTLQSIVKHLLTEGDKLAISQTSALSNQGGYAVASNYGSLVARILFQPVEEISRLYFSKTLESCTREPVQPQNQEAKDPLTKRLQEISSKKAEAAAPEATEEQQAALTQASKTLHALLLLESHLSLVLLVFLPPYLPILLSHFLPSRYKVTTAPNILAQYAYYLPVMSINGILEAFTASTMSAQDLKHLSRFMVLFSVSFIIACYIFTVTFKLGEAGLVWANITNLTLRILYAWWFIGKWFNLKSNGRKDLVSMKRFIPSTTALICFGVSAKIVRMSWAFFGIQDLTAQIKHIAVGGLCVLICAAECYRSQKEEVGALVSFIRSRRST